MELTPVVPCERALAGAARCGGLAGADDDTGTAAGSSGRLARCLWPFDEATILRLGYAYEQATDWHHCLPELPWAA